MAPLLGNPEPRPFFQPYLVGGVHRIFFGSSLLPVQFGAPSGYLRLVGGLEHFFHVLGIVTPTD
jgi:hypothetical protein